MHRELVVALVFTLLPGAALGQEVGLGLPPDTPAATAPPPQHPLDRKLMDLSAGIGYAGDITNTAHAYGTKVGVAFYLNEWLGIAGDFTWIGSEEPTVCCGEGVPILLVFPEGYGFRGDYALAVGPRFYFRQPLGDGAERTIFAHTQVGSIWDRSSVAPSTRSLLVQLGGGIEFNTSPYDIPEAGFGIRFSGNYRIISGEAGEWHQILAMVDFTLGW